MSQNGKKPTPLMTSLTKKPETQNQKISFFADSMTKSFEGFNSSLSAIG